MKARYLTGPRICVCCGEPIVRQSENPNVCIACFAFGGSAEEPQPPLPKSAANLNWTKAKQKPGAKIGRSTGRRGYN
jgi:hypothetical protein